ncbi:hypothetical protein [Pseudomonas aeruginosa]|uniref:hypothetical protein n=1 Tax=Pseudomonas aeruginosa TaxID=287 RepID=UPI000FED28A8|nr:hypothetical protein [Pseudomonas aeruginosa]RPX38139.1 hypothetical protein IPC720_12095 [Pseudomonas aeruginosa]
MAVLGSRERLVLQQRGIDVVSGVYGTYHSLTSKGLYWLFNHVHEVRPTKLRFSIPLLKSLASVQPTSNWRNLRITAVVLPTYKAQYYQLAVYLNGSPPRQIYHSSVERSVPEEFNLLSGAPFISAATHGVGEVRGQLTEVERQRLTAGEYIEVAL